MMPKSKLKQQQNEVATTEGLFCFRESDCCNTIKIDNSGPAIDPISLTAVGGTTDSLK
jgi:hypothetical protein